MRNAPHPKLCSGFSLVDIMVGMVVGLLAMLVIMQSFSAFEGQKRTTTTGMEAQENGLMALHAMETEIRQSGAGMLTNGSLVCSQINTYDDNATPTTSTASLMPIQITDGGTGSDTIIVSYNTSTTAGVSSPITDEMPDSSAVIKIAPDATGFNVGDFAMLATPGSGLPCTRLAITGIHTPHGSTNIIHNHGQSNYNPPGGHNIFPPGGYGTSPPSVLINMGGMVQNQYQVLCSSLTTTNLAVAGTPSCTNQSTFTNATPLASNIVSIQAQYGIAPAGSQSVNCWTDATGSACSGTDWAAPPSADVQRIKAIRMAVVARSSLMERPATPGGICTATPNTGAPNYPQWAGGASAHGAIDVTGIANWQCYRYKVYQTIVPLRNVLWANP